MYSMNESTATGLTGCQSWTLEFLSYGQYGQEERVLVSYFQVVSSFDKSMLQQNE